jgi:DNA-binding response OmpR family regulator
MNTPRRILIVDDDEFFAESNKDLLEAYGYEVLMAADGASGLALARAQRPGLDVVGSAAHEAIAAGARGAG